MRKRKNSHDHRTTLNDIGMQKRAETARNRYIGDTVSSEADAEGENRLA
jgi:hypothetical protein